MLIWPLYCTAVILPARTLPPLIPIPSGLHCCCPFSLLFALHRRTVPRVLSYTNLEHYPSFFCALLLRTRIPPYVTRGHGRACAHGQTRSARRSPTVSGEDVEGVRGRCGGTKTLQEGGDVWPQWCRWAKRGERVSVSGGRGVEQGRQYQGRCRAEARKN